MPTSKTVNITSGKVLNYEISAEGYKPVFGSQLITSDRTGDNSIKINMVSSASSDGAYSFGDRLGGISTFIGYVDSVDPETQANQKLAVFVLDAQYRYSYTGYGDDWFAGVPFYDSSESALNAKESATYLNNYVFNNNDVTSTKLRMFYYSRNPLGNTESAIVQVGNNFYSPQLPTYKELSIMANNRSLLDAYDPTVTLNAYNKYAFSNWFWGARISNYTPFAFSCTMYGDSSTTSSGNYWSVYASDSSSVGYTNAAYSNSSCTKICVPVFEIPVN